MTVAGGRPGNSGDVHASLTDTGRSGQIPRLWREAGGAASSGINWHKAPSQARKGGSMASNTADGRLLILAASKPNSGGDINP